jgi:acetate kinase
MGLTPAGGLVMGTRMSELDSGVIRYSFHRLWENLFLDIFVLLWITAAFLK